LNGLSIGTLKQLAYAGTIQAISNCRAVTALRSLIKKNQIQIVHVFFSDSELLAALAIRDSNGCSKIIARRNMGIKTVPSCAFETCNWKT